MSRELKLTKQAVDITRALVRVVNSPCATEEERQWAVLGVTDHFEGRDSATAERTMRLLASIISTVHRRHELHIRDLEHSHEQMTGRQDLWLNTRPKQKEDQR